MKVMAGLLALAGMVIAMEAASQPAGPVTAQAPAGPQRGLARLRVAVEEDLLKLWLRAPLHSLVGFDDAPRNASQRQAIRDLAARLHQPQSLLVTPAVADCLPAAVALASNGIDPALLAASPGATPAAAAPGGVRARETSGPDQGRAAAAPAATGAIELEAAISFRCGRPQALSGLQVMLFVAFPALERIDVDIATPQGESGARLSPNRSSLTW